MLRQTMMGLLGLVGMLAYDGRPLSRIGIRVYKAERELEVWGASTPASPYRLIASYPIAAASGNLGPKRREGDGQVPEGFYKVDRFNPNSQFHLSLGLNYPNQSDRLLGDKSHPGNDIFIHGSDVSIGCLAMTDPVIETVYGLAERAKSAGQEDIPVHIFPCRMTRKNMASLYASSDAKLRKFWRTLQPGYDRFRWSRRFPVPGVGNMGYYSWG